MLPDLEARMELLGQIRKRELSLLNATLRLIERDVGYLRRRLSAKYSPDQPRDE